MGKGIQADSAEDNARGKRSYKQEDIEVIRRIYDLSPAEYEAMLEASEGETQSLD